MVHPEPIIINQEDESVEEEEQAAADDPEIEMETNDKTSTVDEDLIKSDSGKIF